MDFREYSKGFSGLSLVAQGSFKKFQESLGYLFIALLEITSYTTQLKTHCYVHRARCNEMISTYNTFLNRLKI